MKIAFVYPGDRKQIFFHPPLSLGYLASYAMKYGGYSEKDIRIIDENAGARVVEQIEEFKPDVIGITSTTPVYPRTVELAKNIKKIHDDTPIFIGGPHATALPKETLNEKYFDIAVMGEGEATVLDLLKLYEKKSELPRDELSEIDGIAYVDGNSVKMNKNREFITDLDSIPFPARNLMNMEFYLKPNIYTIRGVAGRITHVMSSRGCPYDCIFCSSKLMWKRTVRYFSPEYVISEINSLVKDYDVNGINFQDDTFCANRLRMKKICELLVSTGLNKNLFYSCQLRANLIDKEMLGWLKESGCVQVEYGFESGSERMLKRLKKDSVTVEQNKNAVKLTHEAGLRVLGNFIIGAPGETLEDIRQTERFYKENPIDFIAISILAPYPGTEIWNAVKPDIAKFDWKQFWMGYSGNSIISVADKMTEQELKNVWAEMCKDIEKNNAKLIKAGLYEKIKYLGCKLLVKILPQRRNSRRGFRE